MSTVAAPARSTSPAPARSPSPAPARSPSAAAVLELLKPLTWFAPVWAFGCGVVSAGGPHGRWEMAAAGLVLSGPLACGCSQAVNDWFDREVDRINEPGRPIPSGRMPGRSALAVALVWTALTALFAMTLGRRVAGAALLGLALAWAYSAPPIRLKRNGWLGNLAVGLSYEGLPWFAGAALALGAMPPAPVIGAALAYSLGAHGIMTLNDFKSVAGDRRSGIRTLPVRLGVDRAARVACAAMAAPQVAVAAMLFGLGRVRAGVAVAALLAAQGLLMPRFLRDPRAEAPRYNGTGTLLYVLGMLATAIALAGVR